MNQIWKSLKSKMSLDRDGVGVGVRRHVQGKLNTQGDQNTVQYEQLKCYFGKSVLWEY